MTEYQPRHLTVCSSDRDYPKLFIQGLWLKKAGFEVGAQVTITNPYGGKIVIEQTKSRHIHMRDKRRKYLQERLAELQKELGGFVPERRQKEAELISIRQELGDVA